MASKTINSNITHNGKIYHVQTEIVLEKVITQVFTQGRVIFTLRNNFVDYSTTNKQHKTVEAAIIKDKIRAND